ncbi:hypothetical protein GSI_09493 [Ganoderma sinense ZZ0214-1]|uniref:Uncharacterized protein n=1 Tax=Ganoderma sinense ZZ0214-1 TaxID=1077348 RepID=A0A2G8S3J2_9APHY|nr:hypothetical protein GSI_09493 [Ganoderma sinense ZZ0214-1]
MLALSTVVVNPDVLDILDYDMILQCFGDPLAFDKTWSEDDKAVSRAFPNLRTNSVMPANYHMGSKQRHHGDSSKRKVADGVEHPPLPGDVEGSVYYDDDDDADPVAVREHDTDAAAPRPPLVP